MSVCYARHSETPVITIDAFTTRRILAYRDNLMMVEVSFKTGAVGAVHRHPHTQCTYVLSGVFEFTVDGEPVTVRQGDSLCFEPDQEHGTRCIEEGALLDVFTPMRKDFLKR